MQKRREEKRREEMQTLKALLHVAQLIKYEYSI
jgi:hypothetical protein